MSEEGEATGGYLASHSAEHKISINEETTLPLLLPIAAPALIGAQSPLEREPKPGEGVLCMGTFIYFAERQGASCYAGQDAEYQNQLKDWVKRLDEYLVRNFPECEKSLKLYKQDENIPQSTDPRLCELGLEYGFYENFRDGDRESMAEAIDKLLSRDGPPTIGDRV